MELRHLRYYLAVSEALSFTRAAAQLRVAQPALSRQVQDLEDEIGVDLLKRSPRGVKLTAEGKLFLEEARGLLKRADESVEKVRALARGQYGELHVGYSALPTAEVLPPALAAFQKVFPRVNVVLHDLTNGEPLEELQSGAMHLALMPQSAALQSAGMVFEVLRTYAFYVALPTAHRLARLKTIPLEKIAAEPLLALRRKQYPGYYEVLDRVFSPLGIKPPIVVECDTASSLLTAIESGRGIALSTSVFKQMTGKRLVYRPLTGTNEVLSVGIARAKHGDVTPAGEKFCEMLRNVAKGTIAVAPFNANDRSIGPRS
jgi:DNA-binding transcriptional LysR family regulator